MLGQRRRLLPLPYYLVTFTVPAELRALIRSFGWLSAAAKTNWQRILALLDWTPPPSTPPTLLPPPLCPSCHKPMKLLGPLSRAPPF